MLNPFDFDEATESRQFENDVIYGGASPSGDSTLTTTEFMRRSMAAANMVATKVDGEVSDTAFIVGAEIVSARSARTASSAPERGPDSSSLSQVVHERPQFTAQEFTQLQKELNQAKKTIESMKQEKWLQIPVKETVMRMIQGKQYWLEGYRSLTEKKDLLDSAIKTNDGNSILTVVLFLEKTLKTSIFRDMLLRRSTASSHYIQHLRQTYEWIRLEEYYTLLSMTEEAGLVRYEHICCLKDVSKKVQKLNNWLSDYSNKSGLEDLTIYVNEEIKLLELQKEMQDEADKRAQTASDTTTKYTPSPQIVMRPLITTISYATLHHDKNSKYAPEVYKKIAKVTDKQYEWAVLPPLANLHKWNDVQQLLTSTNWLRRKGENSYIGYENVVTVLEKANANEEIMVKYLNLISNVDLRLKYAARLQYHQVAIDSIVQLRDRERMEAYRIKIGSASKYRQKINDLLNNSSIKWR